MLNDLLILLFYTSTTLLLLGIGGYIADKIPQKWIDKI